MTAVFVHGVPETSMIWDELRARLDRDSVALALPGFGNPRPQGFSATKDAYAQWLAGELDQIAARDGEPVDLVGHDWGALLAVRVACAYEVPLRSWSVDVAGINHPDHVWHPTARVWQSVGAGEQWMSSARDAGCGPGSFAHRLEGAGVPAELARAMGSAHDQTMSDCILDLYRSAVPNIYAGWGGQLLGPTRSAGLVLLLPDDPTDEAMSLQVAAALGASTDRLDVDRHCWMAADPSAAVEVLERFWTQTAASGADVALREVTADDIEIFYAHQRDPVASAMAAFPARDREQFLAHWARIRANPSNYVKTIVVAGAVAGNVVSWEQSGERAVGYWLGRAFWGRGIATSAVRQFLDRVGERPLYAHVAVRNAGSNRVLQKCGFQVIDRVRAEDGVEEFRYVLT